MEQLPRGTSTSRFGVGRRESHDARDFYARFHPPVLSGDDRVHGPLELDEPIRCGDSRALDLPDASVALVVTSPPYFAGKEYETALGEGHIPATYMDYLGMLRDVFAECARVLEPGGRIAVNVANLGRRPYRSLSADVSRILQDDLGLLLRGEVVWTKAEGASGSCAWGSYRSAANPVLRDVTERVVVASKGRFDRARPPARRQAEGLPHRSTLTTDEFLEATLDVWRIPAESARRVNHPAPFPVELPLRLINLYTYEGDLVLDPFLGSGSTAVAAARSARRYVGYDTDPGYVAAARARVAGELDRRRAEAAVGQAGPAGPAGLAGLAGLAGDGLRAVAEEVLERAGFKLVDGRVDGRDDPALGALRGTGVSPDLVAVDGRGERWYVELSGGLTVTRSGLLRTDVLWRSLGRLHVLAAAGVRPVLLVTSHLPPPGSAGDRSLRAVGTGGFFDAVSLLDAGSRARLAAYGGGGVGQPVPGFWTAEELSRPGRSPG